MKLLLPKNEEIFQKMVQFWAKLGIRCSFTRVKLIGVENIPAKRGFIIAANHSSYIDNLVLLAELPVRFKIVAAKIGFYMPLIRRMYRGAGYIPTGYRMDFADQMTLYRNLKEKQNVLIFSRVSKQGEVGEFTEALATAARVTGMPVLPVCIQNSADVLPLKKFILKERDITVRIGKLIENPELKILQDTVEKLYHRNA